MTFEELQKANATISTTPIKGKDYAEVNQRIKAFRMLFPMGTIKTSLISDDGNRCVMVAEVYDEEDGLLGTGTAFEKADSSFINKTSYIENCETSAVGRALAMCGIGIDVSIASAEEVNNAIANQGDANGTISKKEQVATPKAAPKAQSKPAEPSAPGTDEKISVAQYGQLVELAQTKGVEISAICQRYGIEALNQLPAASFGKVVNALNKS